MKPTFILVLIFWGIFCNSQEMGGMFIFQNIENKDDFLIPIITTEKPSPEIPKLERKYSDDSLLNKILTPIAYSEFKGINGWQILIGKSENGKYVVMKISNGQNTFSKSINLSEKSNFEFIGLNYLNKIKFPALFFYTWDDNFPEKKKYFSIVPSESKEHMDKMIFKIYD